MVFALTGVMIVGFIVLVVLFVTRFGATPQITLPDTITLPDGTEAAAFTVAPGWYAVVTTGDEILIFDRDTGALRQRVQVE